MGEGLTPDDDRRFMGAALRIGRRALGRTAPNPSVGALIVCPRTRTIVGVGATARGGRPHAETQALEEAGVRAKGAVAYVTLEPCAHHGKTPPCCEALIAAGVSRVVTALEDPDKRVAGKGHALLRAAGISVTSGVLSKEARCDHRGFLSRVTRGRPFVTLKLALSADGGIGLAGKGQVAITGEAARRFVQALRIENDAIAVGQGTAFADQPRLTVRLAGLEGLSPRRIVFAGAAPGLPQSLMGEGTLVISAKDVALEGARTLTVKADPAGRPDLAAALDALGAEGVNALLVEGGARLAHALIEADLVDEILILTAPVHLGEGLVPAFGIEKGKALGFEWLVARPGYRVAQTAMIGNDRLTRFSRIS